MHWENLPKVTHNEDAIREYELAESKRIAIFLKWVMWVVLPIALLIAWFMRN